MRRALVTIHRWIGLALAAWVLLLCLTGSVLVYRPELYRAFEPQPLEVVPGPALLPDEAILASARRAFPGEEPAAVWRGRVPNHAVEVDLVSGEETRGYLFDPYTGRPLRAALPWDFWLVGKALELHTDLLGGPSGRTVNGALALGFVFLVLTGTLAWRARRGAETRARTTSLRRLHMTVGVWAALFVFVWALTGLHLAWPEVSIALVDHFEPFDELNPVERVGDQVSYWLAYLHFGRFGGRIPGCERGLLCDEGLKALWALVALAPAFLAATGAILWLRGRRARARLRMSPIAADASVGQPAPMADDRKRKWNTAGGVSVVLLTGILALGFGPAFDGSPVNIVIGLVILALTLGGAIALARFVARHGDEIGEARFDTRNKDEDRP